MLVKKYSYLLSSYQEARAVGLVCFLLVCQLGRQTVYMFASHCFPTKRAVGGQKLINGCRCDVLNWRKS